MDQLMLLENPRYKKRRSRRSNPGGFLGNPAKALALPSTAREWTQGITVAQGIAGAGGLVAAVLIPGAIIKTADTTGRKAGRIALAVASALGVGAAAKAFIGTDAGKAAVIGGVAGTAVMIIEMVTGRALLQGFKRVAGPVRRIGESRAVSPGFTTEVQTSVT